MLANVMTIRNAFYGTIGEVKGKVLAMGSSPKTIQRWGVESNMLSIIIADESAQIKLQLWDSQISAVKMHTSYAFTKLSVREYEGEKFLTTTKNSAIVEIENVSVPATIVLLTIDNEESLHTTESEVLGVKLTSNFNCRSCYRRQSASFDARQAFQRCEGCQLLRKSSHFLATTSGVLHVGIDGVEVALTLNNSVLKSFLETNRLTHLLEDKESLEMHFLTLEKVKISFNAERFIKKLSHTEQGPTASV
ncbi:hypothetical protein ABVT39_005523 [Epinephelus coioides]